MTTESQTEIQFSDFTNHLKNNNLLEASKLGRQLIKQFDQQQFELFDKGEDTEILLDQRSAYVDHVLKQLWKNLLSKEVQQKAALIAVGGYGRKELHPYSDIDILIICEQIDANQEVFSSLITFLWDLGFQVGHAIRSFQETIDAAKEDVSTATNLLESRWLTGNYDPFQKLQLLWRSKKFWPSQAFFNAKMAEQAKRHQRFNNALYQLEPNIKESPGGLRDIQNLLWVAKRHFGADSLQELIKSNFISNEEFYEIRSAYAHLSRIRFVLHRHKKRHEDRLSFDNQQNIAEMLGYEEIDGKMAVEVFMSGYYQTVRSVAKLNEILLQHFREEIFLEETPSIIDINPRFLIINDYLDVKKDTLFEKNPTALLEVFIILENYAQIIKGIRSRTIRLIRNNLHLINDEFRSDPINKALFIEIFRQPKGVHSSISRMHGYGILGAYLPVFEKVTGLMQFNIFHAYTVDEHTILVIRHLRRFFLEEHAYEFPTAHQIAKNLCKPEILILAGLFHDIGKGRGGSHEVVGAKDTIDFSFKHNLTAKDSELLYWLVRRHLDFSSVAQRKDLSDPQVINDFAKLMETQEKLDYLYLLTVADVLSTSKDVWNEWKNSLFLQLYNATSDALNDAKDTPHDRKKIALKNQEKAKEVLVARGITTKEFQPFWDKFANTLFFSHQSGREIARITKLLYQQNPEEIYTVLTGKSFKGASELIIFMPGRDYLFAHFTHILDRLNLNIVEAKTYSGQNDQTLVLIYFLNQDNSPIEDKELLAQLEQTIQTRLAEEIPQSSPSKAESRRMRYFETPTEISFAPMNAKLTELSINTKDIPGLLAKIGQAFKNCEVRVHDAKIHTIGEKAEDVFLISDIENKAISDNKRLKALEEELTEQISAEKA